MGSCMQKKSTQRAQRLDSTLTNTQPNRKQLILTPIQGKEERNQLQDTTNVNQMNNTSQNVMSKTSIRQSAVNVEQPQEQQDGPTSLKVTRMPHSKPEQRTSVQSNTNNLNYQTGNSASKSNLSRDSLAYIGPHKCVVSRASNLQNTNRMIDLQNSQNLSQIMGSNMKVNWTYGSVVTVKEDK